MVININDRYLLVDDLLNLTKEDPKSINVF